MFAEQDVSLQHGTNEQPEQTLLFKDFSANVMPVDFQSRVGYGGVPGYTVPPNAKARRRARDLASMSLTKAAGRKSFDQLEKILREKIRGKTRSGGLVLFRMFRKFDINKDGVIDFGEFKNGMLKWNMNLDDEELHELFDRYDQGGKGHVSYYEFIKHLLPDDFVSLEKMKGMGGLPGQTKEDPSKNKLTLAAQRAERNARRGAVGLGSDDQLENILREKINGKTKAGGSMLFRTFRKFDTNKDGVIDSKEFREIMHKWNLNMGRNDMNRLFRRYDKDGKGHIKYYEFLQHLMPADFPDKNSLIEKMGSSSPLPSSDYARDTMSGYEKAKLLSTHNVEVGYTGLDTVAHLEQILRDKIMGKSKAGGSELFRTFRKFDTNKDGVIDFEEFSHILNQWNLNLDNHTLAKLFHRYDKGNVGHIQYYDFIKHLLPDDFIPADKLKNMGGMPGGSTRAGQRQAQRQAASLMARNAMVASQVMSVDKLEMILREKIMMKTKGGPRELYLAFQKFDHDASGDISFEEFQRVVRIHFNLEITEQNMKKLYQRFLPKTQPRTAKRVSTSRLKIRPATPNHASKPLTISPKPEDSMEEIHGRVANHPIGRRLVKLVLRRSSELQKKLDAVCRFSNGLVTRAELRFVICQMGIHCNDADCLEIVRLAGCSRRASVEYKKLIAILGAPKVITARMYQPRKHGAKYTPRIGRQGKTLLRSGFRSRSTADLANTLHERLHAPEAAMSELRQVVKSSWKRLLSMLKGQDTRRKGYLSPNTFRRVLYGFNVHLSEETMRFLKKLFGNSSNGKGISYTEFIKYFTVDESSKSVRRAPTYIPRKVSLRPSASAPSLAVIRNNKLRAKVQSLKKKKHSSKYTFSKKGKKKDSRALYSSNPQREKAAVVRNNDRAPKKNPSKYAMSVTITPSVASNDTPEPFDTASICSSVSSYRVMSVDADDLFTKQLQQTNNAAPMHTNASKMVCRKLKERMMHMWKPIRLELKRIDRSRKGYIPGRKFREILAKYSLNMDENDFFSVLEVFEKKPRTSGQKVYYDMFIRACISAK